MTDLDAVNRSIAGTREGLAVSGYAIDCAEGSAGALRFTVRALEGACEECLIPKAIFTEILTQELADGGITGRAIELVYPLDDGA
jgi:hypothetical protein